MVNDATKTQSAQTEFFDGEVHDDGEIWQNYGFTSIPPKGSEGLAIFMRGERENPILVATENKDKRKTGLKEGDAAVYSSAENYVHLKQDGNMEFKANQTGIITEKISIKNSTAEIIELLSLLCDTLAKDKVNTLLGPQPLLGFNIYAEIKSKIDSFKA